MKNSENFRLNDIFSSSSLLPLSLVLISSSPKIMVRVYGGDGSLGSSGSRKPGFRMIFGMIPMDSHSSSSVCLYERKEKVESVKNFKISIRKNRVIGIIMHDRIILNKLHIFTSQSFFLHLQIMIAKQQYTRGKR